MTNNQQAERGFRGLQNAIGVGLKAAALGQTEHAAGWDAAKNGDSLDASKSLEWTDGWFDYWSAQCK